MARTPASTGTTTGTIGTANLSTGHAATPQKEPQLELSSKASAALNTSRRLLEKTKNVDQISTMIRLISNHESSKVDINKPEVISGLSDQETELLAASIYTFLTSVTRTRVNRLTADLFVKELQRLKFPEDPARLLAECVYRNLALVEDYRLACPINRLQKMTWRLDVIITSQAGKRLLEPMFLLCLQTDSTRTTFEVSLTQFHKLRYSIAAVLKEVQNLVGRKIMIAPT